MYARPWIRAAASAGSGSGARPNDGHPVPGSGVGNVKVGGASGRDFRGHASLSAPRIYNPPRAFSSPAPAHTFASTTPATVGPRIYTPGAAGHATAVNANPRIDNAPRAGFTAPHATFNNPPVSYGAARSFGAAVQGPSHVYNPAPARSYGPPPSAAPSNNGFASAPARVYSPPPRTFDPPAVQHMAAPSFHQASMPPQMRAAPAPAHNFGAPAAGAFGGGGTHFGGGVHRR